MKKSLRKRGDRLNICNKKNCTGCCACLNICPNMCIKMEEDIYGFVYPVVNNEICINCDKCKKVCPVNNEPLKLQNDNVFATYAIDDKIHEGSTSGGLAHVLSLDVLRKGGVVYGHGFDKDLSLRCVRIESQDELSNIQGTKYIQSSIGLIMKNIKQDLMNEKKVLFIGTPCQVSGLLNYLGEQYTNIYTVSFICGGVPSQKFFFDYINDRKLKKCNRIFFRDNNEYGFRFYSDNQLLIKEHRWKSSYFIGFDEHIILRDCCYECQYTQLARVGDLTIGDFWGIKSKSIDQQILNKGVSLSIPTTIKGIEMMNDVLNYLVIENYKLKDACKKNPRLCLSVQRDDNVDKFRKKYVSVGFDKAINSLYGNKYRIYRLKSIFKRIRVLDIIYHWIRKE